MPRFRPRWLLVPVVGMALLALLTTMGTDAARYREAAGRYREYADAYDPVGRGAVVWSSCYGETWDGFTDQARKDRETHHGDRPYLSSHAAHFRRLEAKYERAAARPWPWLRTKLDPPLHP